MKKITPKIMWLYTCECGRRTLKDSEPFEFENEDDKDELFADSLGIETWQIDKESKEYIEFQVDSWPKYFKCEWCKQEFESHASHCTGECSEHDM